MCGIVVAARLKTEVSQIKAEVQEEIMRFWHTELMMLTEERGKDAAGSALIWEDGSLLGIKNGKSVSDLICDWDPDDKKKSYLAFMRVWRKYNDSPVSAAIGHCRKLSIGTAWKNENNHPHYIGKKLILVHNGTLKNHDKLKEAFKFDCNGDTDSEVIARLVHHVNHEKPTKKDKGIFTMDQAEWIVNKLDGSFACVAMNADNPYQMLVFRDGRPFELAFSKPAGLVFGVSDSKYFNTVLARYERTRRYYGLDHWPDLDLTKQMMPDDTAWIINLKDAVTEDTKIRDLVESKPMPRSAQREKDFMADTKTTYTAGYVNNQRTTTPTKTDDKDDKKDDNAETREIDGKERQVSHSYKNGYIWHREERIYVKQDFKDLGKGVVADVEVSKTDYSDSEATENTKIEVEDATTTVKEADNKKNAEVKSVPSSEIVDEEKPPKTMDEAAEEYAEANKEYDSLKEIGEDIGVTMGETAQTELKVDYRGVSTKWTLKGAADKIKEACSKESFIDGWKACEASTGLSLPNVRDAVENLTKETEKKKKAENRIVALKGLATFTVSMLDYLSDSSAIDQSVIDSAVEMVKSLNQKLDSGVLNSVFTDREAAIIGLDKVLATIDLINRCESINK